MCGIIGIVSLQPFSVKTDLLKSLQRLEYRGYDSAGFAAKEGILNKATGGIQEFIDSVDDAQTTLAISHTRWATHGKANEKNAHPHINPDKTIFVVHNGIIENFEAFRSHLEAQGYTYETDTDSEIIPYYFDAQKKAGRTIEQAIPEFIKDAEGTFATLIFEKDSNTLFALKRDSPLALGIIEGDTPQFILGSDIYSFSHKTNKAIFFGDNEYAVLKQDGYQFYDKEGNPITKEITEFEWTREDETKEHFDHYMIKEVKEQPVTSKRLVEALKTTDKEKLSLLASKIKNARRVVFVACGTSYHASLVGCSLLNSVGIEAHTIIASEFESFMLVDENTLVIAISQSGETMDVVTVLKDAKKKGAKIASIVNVPFSTIQRLSEVSMETRAGQEICVAATKTFTNQLILLFALAKELGYAVDLDEISGKIQQTIAINESSVQGLAKELKEQKNIFVLGRGVSYPMAREIALKLKEISYIHAEGMMAGELKHGTIALVEQGTPIICLIPNDDPDMHSSTQEVEARGARTIIISNVQDKGTFVVPKSDDAEFAIYACIIGHLLSYYIAKENDLPIDKPRNLAKSVTVH